jgi:hypothetical protein
MKQVIEHLGNPFYAPFESVLVKGKEEDGKWMVYLEASNELEDQEGETVDLKAMQSAADNFLSKGILSWDHKHKQTNDPGFIIGEPLEVKFTEDKKTLVKGFLYKENDIAQKVWKNLKSGAKRLGSSIGGGILSKAGDRIKRVIWDELAITHKPVNDGTMGSVSMIPYSVFAKSLSYDGSDSSIEDFVKALTAGSGVDAGSFTGGRALTGESLQGSTVQYIVKKEELDTLFNSMIKSMMTGEIEDYNDMVSHVLSKGYHGPVARQIINHIAQNFSLHV